LTEHEVSIQGHKDEKVKLGETVLEKSKEVENLQSEVESAKTSLQAQIDISKKEQAALLDKLSNSSSEIQNLKAEMELKHADTEKKMQELNALKIQVDNELAEERKSRQNEVSEMKRKIELVQIDSNLKEKSWQDERSNITNEITSLKAGQELLLSNKIQLQQELQASKSEVENERQKLVDSTKSFELEKSNYEMKIADVEKDLDLKAKSFEKLEADHAVTESRLQLEINTLAESMSGIRTEWVMATEDLQKVTQENEDLHGRIVVLEATAQNNADERRSLLERCLHSEQTVDQLNDKNNDLKKKLNDAQSAMHELGRENQALQVKHTTTISRRWTDDKSSTQCTSCNKTFSLTLRKHHCRHCGSIFCHDCSSRTVTLAASKNPVRVCDGCFDEVGSIK